MIEGIESVSAKVMQIKQVAEGFYEMELLAPEIAKKATPGQFLMVKSGDTLATFLARPMGIYDVDLEKGTIFFLFEAHGYGTKLLSKVSVGDELPLIAPLGNGFDVKDDKKVLVIGGGVGFAPLYPVVKDLEAKGIEAEIIIAAQTKDRVLSLDRTSKHNFPVTIFTDDGTMGEKGYATSKLPEILANGGYDRIYCCGPSVMMRMVAEIAEAADVPCQVSLEERMGCGFGICVCCVIDHKDKDGNISKKRVCYDGPVFDSKEVVWHG